MAKEKYGAPVQVVGAAEMTLITRNPNVRAAFRTSVDAETKQRDAVILVQKGTTEYELFHEMMHAKQYAHLGFEAYWNGQTTVQREEFVYQELLKSNRLSKPETDHASDYLHSVEYGNWLPKR